MASYISFLESLLRLVKDNLRKNISITVNILTNEIFANQNRYCGAGINSFALFPDGKLYVCPGAFYCDKESAVCSLTSGILTETKEFDMDNAPLCKECHVRHCRRCLVKNKLLTGEYSIPSEMQCVVGIWNTIIPRN